MCEMRAGIAVNSDSPNVGTGDIFPLKSYSSIKKPLYCDSNVRILNVQKETLFRFFKDHFLKKWKIKYLRN